MTIGLSRIYKVNGHMVIANSPEKAIEIFIKAETPEGTLPPEILSIILMSDGTYPEYAYFESIEKEDK